MQTQRSSGTALSIPLTAIIAIACLAAILFNQLTLQAMEFHARDYTYYLQFAAKLLHGRLTPHHSLNPEGFNFLGFYGVDGEAGLHAFRLEVGRPLQPMLAGTADNAWPFPQLFIALVLLVAGSTLVTSGRLYNYIVSLFYRRPIRQGILGRPLFRPNLERVFFGVAGLVSIGAGIGLYLLAVAYHLTDATAAAPWFLPAMSALLVLNGIQLIASWVLALMLQTLSQRDLRVRDDLGVPETLPVSQSAATIRHTTA